MLPNGPHCSDMFQLILRLALIETFLNNRPMFGLGENYFTPEIFQIQTLKMAQTVDHELLSEILFPTNQTLSEAVTLLATESRNMLTKMASDISAKLLNFRNFNESHLLQIGALVFLTDKIMKKIELL